MHGGISPGAPKGNTNAFKHRHYTAEAIATRREIAKLFPLRFQVGPPALSGIPRHQWGTPPRFFGPSTTRSTRSVRPPSGMGYRHAARRRTCPARYASISAGCRHWSGGRPVGLARGAPTHSRQAGAQHFQQCAESLPLRLRSWSARHDNIARSARREAAATATVAPPCNRQRPFFVAGDREGSSVRETESFINSALGKWGQIERRLTGRNKWT
jgi:hypothetical protein